MQRATTYVRPALLISGALVVILSVAWTATARRGTTARPIAPVVELRPVEPAANAPMPASREAVTRAARAPRRAAPRPAVAATVATPASAGMRAYYDPETGTIGAPSAATPQPAEVSLSHGEMSVEGRASDGSPMVDLKGTLQEYSVMRVTPDGRRVMRCVQNPKTAFEGDVAGAAKPVVR